jgi:hypothetical protein
MVSMTTDSHLRLRTGGRTTPARHQWRAACSKVPLTPVRRRHAFSQTTRPKKRCFTFERTDPMELTEPITLALAELAELETKQLASKRCRK